MKSNDVIVGKNIIELLTTGMYHNPLVIFREYVQNSVDSINEALKVGILNDFGDSEIHIEIKSEEKSIVVSDNGIGVSSDNAWRTLTSIADSGKDRTRNLGFRGIGRLAGLAYCEKMVIETSCCGEPSKTVLTWDGKNLKNIIVDKEDRKLAAEVIESIVDFETTSEDEEIHFFKVTLLNVKNERLLDVASVETYLSMVAPIQFYHPQFMFLHDIRQGLIDRGVPCDGYRIFVNTKELFKPYRNYVYQKERSNKKKIDELIDVKFFELHASNSQLLAVGWYSLTKNMQLVPVFNEAWGIRFRKGNIQIGDEYSFQRFFRENRFHRYFFGEIHVVHGELFPNGQRDYFDECELLHEFERELGVFTDKLQHFCRKASDWNSAEKKIDAYSKEIEKYEETLKSQEFLSPSHEEEERAKLEKIRIDSEKAKKQLEKVERLSEEDHALKRFVDFRRNNMPEEKKSNNSGVSPKNKKDSEKRYMANKLSRLNKREQKLVGEIYDVIRTILPPDLQGVLIYKIQEKFGLTNESD